MFKNILIFLLGIVSGSILYLHILNKIYYIETQKEDNSIIFSNLKKRTQKEEHWDKFLNEYLNKINQLYEKIFKSKE